MCIKCTAVHNVKPPALGVPSGNLLEIFIETVQDFLLRVLLGFLLQVNWEKAENAEPLKTKELYGKQGSHWANPCTSWNIFTLHSLILNLITDKH